MTFENDFFAGSNRYYTSGIKLTAHFLSQEAVGGDMISSHLEDANHGFIVSIGQEIYTPLNQLTTELVKNDRPYAARLYASFST